MLTISQVSKAFAGRILFEDASLQVNRGDRVGLVGPNGAGKSTLFSLILGEASPDEGKVSVEKSATIGFLPQEHAPAGDETVLELACAVSPEITKAQRIMKTTPEDSAEHHEALHAFDEHGGWQLEPKAKRILAGLAFRESDFDRPAKALSGGWVMRAHLARLLVQEPDLLLLDEPTNHLDLESLVWFQEYLRNYPGAILMISHDREFLNQLVGSIIEIAHRRLNRYRGNWDSYIEQRAAREEQQLSAYKNQQKEIASLQLFADRFRAKASKASQAQSKLKQIDRMEKIEAPVSRERTVHFRFPQPPRSGHRVITLEGSRARLWRSCGLSWTEFRSGEGTANCAGGPERRRKIDVAKAAGGSASGSSRCAGGRSQREGRLFFSVSRRDARSEANGAGNGARHAEPRFGADCPDGSGLVSFPGRRCFQDDGRPEWWGKDAARPGQVAARSAESSADGRTDDASGHRQHRCAGWRARRSTRAR